jgi:hypothetical protein
MKHIYYLFSVRDPIMTSNSKSEGVQECSYCGMHGLISAKRVHMHVRTTCQLTSPRIPTSYDSSAMTPCINYIQYEVSDISGTHFRKNGYSACD